MTVQWPLVIFTLFVCLTCGSLGVMATLALRGKGERIQLPIVVLAAISLAAGGAASLTHLQRWDRIFNGFGHLTSGITQELIGCVALVVVMVMWIVALRKQKVNAVLAWATLVVALGMVAATAHSYWMPGRPTWGIGLSVFFLTDACLLGGVAVWLVSAIAGDEQAAAFGAREWRLLAAWPSW